MGFRRTFLQRINSFAGIGAARLFRKEACATARQCALGACRGPRPTRRRAGAAGLRAARGRGSCRVEREREREREREKEAPPRRPASSTAGAAAARPPRRPRLPPPSGWPPPRMTPHTYNAQRARTPTPPHWVTPAPHDTPPFDMTPPTRTHTHTRARAPARPQAPTPEGVITVLHPCYVAQRDVTIRGPATAGDAVRQPATAARPGTRRRSGGAARAARERSARARSESAAGAPSRCPRDGSGPARPAGPK